MANNSEFQTYNNPNLDKVIIANASPLFNSLYNFNRKWSPRSPRLYHQSAVINLLSTIAAKRVCADFGSGEIYTDFYILLFGKSGLYHKSEALKPMGKILQSMGLDFLKLPNRITPESLFDEMSPDDIDTEELLPISEIEKLKYANLFSSKRVWHFNEFGGTLEAMLKDGGVMSAYRTLLREFADYEKQITYRTRSRGKQKIDDPYLTLVGNATPLDFRQIGAKKINIVMGDGLLARFLVATPLGEPHNNYPFPREQFFIPDEIMQPLGAWHKRLGIPSDDNPYPQTRLTLSEDVYKAFIHYDNFLRDTADTLHDSLNANYIRQSSKTLRLAILLSSINGQDTVELWQWYGALKIMEGYRKAFHDFYTQINNPSDDEKETWTEYIMNILENQAIGGITLSKIINRGRKLKGMKAYTAKLLTEMSNTNMIVSDISENGTMLYFTLDQYEEMRVKAIELAGQNGKNK